MIKHIKIVFFFFSCVFIFSNEASANHWIPKFDFPIDQDSISPTKKKFFPLPIYYRTPETGSAFGVGAVMTFRFRGQTGMTPRSQLQLAAAYTVKQQLLLYLPFEMYMKKGKLRLYGEVGYFRYVYPFYGVGDEVLEENVELFNVNFPRIEINLVHEIRPNLFVGIISWNDGFDIVKRDPNGQLIKNIFRGSEGGLITSLGTLVSYDSRNHNFFPTKGTFAELSFLNYSKAIGSDFNFQKIILNARNYFDLGKEKVFALQLYSEFNFGDVPFSKLSLMGGPKRMRGYIEGQYRDEHYLTLQSEFRFPIYWKFGGVLFASAGTVGSRENKFDTLFPSYGLGLRFRLLEKDKLNLRLDYALGKNTSGFYLTFSEAF